MSDIEICGTLHTDVNWRENVEDFILYDKYVK